MCDSINAKRPIPYISSIPTVPLSVSTATTTTTATTKTTATTANLVKRKCSGSKDTSIYGFSSHSIAQVSEEKKKNSNNKRFFYSKYIHIPIYINILTTTGKYETISHMLCAYGRQKKK